MSLEEARNLVKDKDYTKAEAAYLQLLDRDVSDAGDKIKNEQESAILELGSL